MSKVLVVVLLVALITGVVARPGWAQTTGYRLPWRYCFWEQVLQGWGESPSHNNTQMWYAYDFGLSEGVPVRAAKGGTVAFVQKGKNLCGGFEFRNDANYVTIYHPDGTATLYLHLRDVYVSVGQSISRGQTIGTAGRTGWTYCNPHLHFQRQNQGAWITDSKAVYVDEYPGQQLQRYGWYQSQNYWPGDRCPTRAGAGWWCSGVLSIAAGRRVSRRKGGLRVLVGVLAMGLAAVLLSGCGQPRPVQSEGGLPGTPAMPLGPDQPVVGVTPTLVPATEAPPPPPTPGPVPTPRPIILPSAKEVQQLTEGWKTFEDIKLGIRFRYPPEYEIRVQPATSRKVFISIDRPWGEGREPFDDMMVFLLEKEDPRLCTPEGLEAWIQALPEDENPIPGRGPIRVLEKIEVGGRPAFVIQEPLWPGDPPNLQSVIVIGKERVLWTALASELGMSPEQVEKLWPQQMAFLATLEVFR